MRIKTFYLTFLALILFTTCENLNDIGSLDTEYSVFINLTVNRDKQELFFYNTLAIDSAINGYPFGSNDEFFVDNPYLSFTDEEGNTFDNFALEQRPVGSMNRKYITNMSPFQVLPETEYKVFIQMDNVNIESRVKSLPKFDELNIELGPDETDGETISIPMTLSWDNITHSKYYIMERKYYHTIQITDSTFYSGSSNRIDFTLADQENYLRTFSLTSVIESQYVLDSLYIKLTAYDNNLYKHFYEKNDQVNISNAFGYIGSSSVVDTVITFR
jgi:hypothetical protein